MLAPQSTSPIIHHQDWLFGDLTGPTFNFGFSQNGVLLAADEINQPAESMVTR